jgi:hypothetical protein
VIIKAEHSEVHHKHYSCVIKTGHSVGAVITTNKGKYNAEANKTKQIEPLGDT